MKKDQYGEKVPGDLVLLPDIEGLSQEEIDIIDNADWYEVNRILMASAKQIKYLSEDNPLDAGIDPYHRNTNVYYVDHALHRYDDEGFYHA